MNNNPWVNNSSRVWVITISLLGIASIFLVYRLRVVLTPFAIAFFLSYMLDPLIDKLETWKIPRTLAICILMTLTFAILFLGSLKLVFYIKSEVINLADNMDNYVLTIKTRIIPWIEEKSGISLPINTEELKDYFQKTLAVIQGKNTMDQDQGLSIRDSGNIIKLGYKIVARIISWIYSLFSQVFGLMNIIIVPIATFYLLKDIDHIKSVVQDNLPRSYKDVITRRIQEMDAVLAGFIRGQLTVCVILGTLYSIGLLIIGVDFAIVIGFIAGLANIVPYFGLIVGIIPALFLSFLEFQDMFHPVMVVIVFSFAQLLEGTIITPKIVGDKIGLHPVLIMIAIVIGGDLFGFLGILLALPVASVIMVLFRAFHESYRKSTLFLDTREIES